MGVTTTTGAINSKFIHSDNRLTCTASVSREYLIQVSATIIANTSTTCSIGKFTILLMVKLMNHPDMNLRHLLELP